MVKREELIPIIIAIFLLGILFGLRDLFNIPLLILYAAIVIGVNVGVKEFVAYILDTGLTVNLWHFQRYGFRKHLRLKEPFPVGILVPVLFTFISVGYVVWSAILQYDVYALRSRVSKRIGAYRFSDVTDFHVGLIGAAGIFINLIVAFLAYLLNLPALGLMSMYYAFFNLIPISNLDGTKIFFGSIVMWFFLAILTAIAIIFSLVVV